MSPYRGAHSSGKFSFSPRRRNRRPCFRLSLEKKGYSMEEGGERMVKGVSKRVIVVNKPDQRYFDQAIFILRNDFAVGEGVSEKEILREAKRAARSYLRRGEGRVYAPLQRLRGLLCALAGAAVTAGAWFAVQLMI